MKLLFVINNIQEAYYEYENTGSMPAVKKRSVEIELTDEQVRKIGIRNIGYSSRTPITETIESVSLLLEGAEWRINSVWHDNTTIPDRGLDKKLGVGKDVLLKPKYSKIYELCEVLWDFNENCIYLSGYRETFLINNIEIWAYLEDLLPNNKE